MTPLDIQDYRVARLQELLDKKFDGKKVQLGRALGHQTGAFVRQLLDRERPISEKTVLAIHALPGCHGWFDQAGAVKTQAVLQQPAAALDRPQLAEQLADALGDALQALPAAMYARSVDACRRLAEAPDSNRARTEMWDVLQHSDALKSPPATARAAESSEAAALMKTMRKAAEAWDDPSQRELLLLFCNGVATTHAKIAQIGRNVKTDTTP